ncbi:MAG: restriction endonuclease subunit S [Streptococcus vestibularis]|nr:restriction endonuclease subunit S [Streptococcus vestibularis]
MSKTKNNMNKNPKVVFSNFKNCWRHVAMYNLAKEFKSGGTPSTKELNYWNGKIPWIQSSDLQNDSLFGVKPQKFISEEGLQNSSAKLISKSSIAIVTRVGVGKLAIIDQDYTTSQDFLSLSDLNGDTQFLVYRIYRMLQRESTQLQGTSIKGITKEDLLSKRISIPESLEEQSTIGSLFRTLDDLLTSYKNNLANYQSLKAAMLSKMFPKAGQTVPEIRLDGFKGEWEVKKLENVLEFYAGLTYKPNDMVSDGTLVLRSSNVRDGELIYKDNVFVNPDIVNCQNVKLGDIVVVVRNGSRDLIGKHALIKSEMPNTVIGAFMTGVRCEVPEFVNALLDTNMFISEINKNLGATINQITTGNFKRMKFHFPDKEEQQVIGSYFANLDDLIAVHQEKISQLETLKKKFLKDMFIK